MGVYCWLCSLRCLAVGRTMASGSSSTALLSIKASEEIFVAAIQALFRSRFVGSIVGSVRCGGQDEGNRIPAFLIGWSWCALVS